MSYVSTTERCRGCTRPFQTGDKYRFIRLDAETMWICDGCYKELKLALQSRKLEYETSLRETRV